MVQKRGRNPQNHPQDQSLPLSLNSHHAHGDNNVHKQVQTRVQEPQHSAS